MPRARRESNLRIYIVLERRGGVRVDVRAYCKDLSTLKSGVTFELIENGNNVGGWNGGRKVYPGSVS